MQIDFKGTYSYLTSHTFPGLLAGLEIILFFKLFTPFDGFKILFEIDYKATNLIVLLTIMFVLSTLIGLIIDAIHHRLFRKLEGELNTDEIYKHIRNTDQLNIFNKIDNDYWYYYEAYANILIAIAPGIILVPILLFRLNVYSLLILILITIYACVMWILYDEAKYTLLKVLGDVEEKFVENIKRNNQIDSKNKDFES